MGKFVGGIGVLGSVVVGAVVWFVLFVILGVTLWISFVAGGGVALVGAALALGVGGSLASKSKSSSQHNHAIGAH
jgi:hypothetical protein